MTIKMQEDKSLPLTPTGKDERGYKFYLIYLREVEISPGLRDRGSGVGIPAGKTYYSPLHHSQKDSAAHTDS